jgi:hypothetical protein
MTISLPRKSPRSTTGETHRTSSVKTIKHLGYGQNNQVRLYGEVFDLVSDPASFGENLGFVSP